MSRTQIVLAGNPNSGKTTLFNALTGSQQRVGNWPGVTVEKKQGICHIQDQEYDVVDLPGAYTLDHEQIDGLDERIAAKYIAKMTDGIIVNVVDASNLERHLYLTTQLLETGLPMIVVLTMTDRMPKGSIDVEMLASQLGVNVVEVMAHKQQKLENLYQAITSKLSSPKKVLPNYPQEVIAEVEKLLSEQDGPKAPYWQLLQRASKLIDGGDIMIADARYGLVRELCLKIRAKKQGYLDKMTSKIDKIILHRVLGFPIFLFVMYLMFLFSINVGGVFQECFDLLSEAIFVNGSAHLLSAIHMPEVLTAVFAFGLGKGINTVVTFIPVIGSMFLFLAFLESSGYMARAAFVVDRLMRSIGLPGKAFVPLIVGFGCNVPAIMGTRTLDSEKDRILASLMSPFMSCSARLAIFTVFVSVFFPRGGHNIVFALYLIGIAVAILTGYFLRNTLLDKELTPLLMELPAYHMPPVKAVLRQTWGRLKHFVKRAGRVILPVCTILGAINILVINEHGLVIGGEGDSLLAYMGRWLTPLFKPMGLEASNWPATVGLLMGTLAKEVVIATLNTLYASAASVHQSLHEGFHFWSAVQEAFMTIPENLNKLAQAFFNPILASRPDQELDPHVMGVLAQYFGSAAAAFSYLLFILLYVPCVSTMATIKKELNSFWMYFSIIWSTLIAYMTATLFYQLATIKAHYLQTLLSLLISGLVFWLVREVLKSYSPQLNKAAQGGRL